MPSVTSKIVAISLAGFVSVPALAAESFTVDSRHTFPVFEVNHLGFSTQRGRFNKTSGKITLDAAARNGSIDITIDAASIDMGLDEWDKYMRSEDFFHTEKFPTMTFKSNKVIFEGDKPVAAEGEFTMLGVTRPVKLIVLNYTCGVHPLNKKGLCGADVTTTVRRSEYGMKKYLPAISDDVKISIPVEAFRD